MIFRIAMSNSFATERTLDFVPVFAVLGQTSCWPNTSNRFAYSRREVLLAT